MRWFLNNEELLIRVKSDLQGLFFLEGEECLSFLVELVSSYRECVLQQIHSVLISSVRAEVACDCNDLALEVLRASVRNDIDLQGGGCPATANILECVCLAFAAELLQANISGGLTVELVVALLQGREGRELIWKNVILNSSIDRNGM